ncbi:MAG: Hfq-like protein [Anaerolineae bacterium]
MSLGDTLRLLRARKGGITPLEIEAALPELPKGLYRQMEQRYRAVGDEASIALLADFYGVPFEELRWRLDWSRKALSRALVQAMKNSTPLTLQLWDGHTVTGLVKWWDLGALELVTPDGSALVIQRHAVERWDPRAAEPMTADQAPSADAKQ